MLRLGRERESLNIVDDQFGGPTTSIELADATYSIVSGILEGRFGDVSNWAGLYHMTCSGSVSWYSFAKAIFTRTQALLDGKVPAVNPIHSSEYPTPASRPHNSVLSNEKLYTVLGVRLAPWESALDEAVRRLDVQQKQA
jgi:dTDP-4-dehydrorhamnose reductase